MKQKVKEKICRVCEKKFNVYDSSGVTRSHKLSARPRNCVTCSSECTKEYDKRNNLGTKRISNRVLKIENWIEELNIKINDKIKKVKEQIKKQIQPLEDKKNKLNEEVITLEKELAYRRPELESKLTKLQGGDKDE